MARMLNFTLEKRKDVHQGMSLLATLIAIAAAILVTVILIILAGAKLSEALPALISGSFGNPRAIGETLIKATPLILTALAATIAFRGRVWNIGMEGQFVMGAMASFFAYDILKELVPGLVIPVVLLSGILGGAIWGYIPALLKTYLRVDVIISTVMMNYIVLFILSFLLSDLWQDPISFYLQTIRISDGAHLPALFQNSRLHIGFFLALPAIAIIYFLLEKTPLGYDIRAIGSNPKAAMFKGTNVNKLLIIIMAISGGLAGFAGAIELFGIQHRLRMDISVGFGFTGIIIAMLARLNPLGILPAAIFFGALINGAARMQIMTGVPIALVYTIEGITLLILLSAQVLTNYKITRKKDAD